MHPSRVWFPPLSYSLMELLLRLAAPSAPPRRSSGVRALPRVVLPEAISSECPPSCSSVHTLHGYSPSFFFRSSTCRRATPQFLAASVPIVSRWLIQSIAPLSSSYLQLVCSCGLSLASELLRTGAARRNVRHPLSTSVVSVCLLYVCHRMLSQAAGLVLSAVVATVIPRNRGDRSFSD